MRSAAPNDPLPLMRWGAVLARPEVGRQGEACETFEAAATVAATGARDPTEVAAAFAACEAALKAWDEEQKRRQSSGEAEEEEEEEEVAAHVGASGASASGMPGLNAFNANSERIMKGPDPVIACECSTHVLVRRYGTHVVT